MIFVVMILAAVAAICLELFLPGWAVFGHVPPPLVLCVVAYFALECPLPVAVAAALLAGVARDAAGGLPAGTAPVVFLCLALALRRYRDLIFIRRWITHLALGAALGAADVLLTFFLLRWRLAEPPLLAPSALLMKIGGAACLGAVCLPPVFCALEWLEKMIGYSWEGSEDGFNLADGY